MIGGSVSRVGEDPKFAMTYDIDASQEQVDARLLYQDNLLWIVAA